MSGSEYRDLVGEADALIEAGRPTEAVALLKEAVAAGRAGPLARLALARAQTASGDNTGATETLREAQHLLPSSAQAAAAFGDALAAAGALPVAIAEYQRALRFDPDNGAAHWGLARVWLAAGEPDKALPHPGGKGSGHAG